jgi:hypothetical protein
MAPVASENPLASTVRVPLTVSLGLWAMALFSLFAGIQQQFVPRSFYDDFPGFGMHWVAVDGPFNEHLLRDLGSANLAIAALILFAIVQPTVGLVLAVAVAVLVAQVPHFIYHAAHLDILPTTLDRVFQTGTLPLTLAIPLLILLRSSGIHEERPTSSTRSAETHTGGAAQQQSRLVISTR